MPEDKTKRAAVLNFCSVFGWEPEFTGYEVHIRNHRGSTEIKELFEKNVVSVSKTVDKTGSQKAIRSLYISRQIFISATRCI